MPPMLSAQQSDRPPTASSPGTSTPLSAQAMTLVDMLVGLKQTTLDSDQDYLTRLQGFEKRLTQLTSLSDSMGAGLMQLSSSLAQLQLELSASRQSSGDYQALAEKQIRDVQNERDAWQLAAWAGIGMGAGATIGGLAGGGTGALEGALIGAVAGAGGKLLWKLIFH